MHHVAVHRIVICHSVIGKHPVYAVHPSGIGVVTKFAKAVRTVISGRNTCFVNGHVICGKNLGKTFVYNVIRDIKSVERRQIKAAVKTSRKIHRPALFFNQRFKILRKFTVLVNLDNRRFENITHAYGKSVNAYHNFADTTVGIGSDIANAVQTLDGFVARRQNNLYQRRFVKTVCKAALGNKQLVTGGIAVAPHRRDFFRSKLRKFVVVVGNVEIGIKRHIAVGKFVALGIRCRKRKRNHIAAILLVGGKGHFGKLRQRRVINNSEIFGVMHTSYSAAYGDVVCSVRGKRKGVFVVCAVNRGFANGNFCLALIFTITHNRIECVSTVTGSNVVQIRNHSKPFVIYFVGFFQHIIAASCLDDKRIVAFFKRCDVQSFFADRQNVAVVSYRHRVGGRRCRNFKRNHVVYNFRRFDVARNDKIFLPCGYKRNVCVDGYFRHRFAFQCPTDKLPIIFLRNIFCQVNDIAFRDGNRRFFHRAAIGVKRDGVRFRGRFAFAANRSKKAHTKHYDKRNGKQQFLFHLFSNLVCISNSVYSLANLFLRRLLCSQKKKVLPKKVARFTPQRNRPDRLTDLCSYTRRHVHALFPDLRQTCFAFAVFFFV